MQEIWKDVKGFEGIYKVSNHGRLMSFKGDKNGRVLRNTNKTGGYLSVVLEKGAYPIFSTKMHRLVATHFIPNPLNLPEVNHIDMNKQNNHVDNLEWVDRKTNHNHAVKNNPSMIAGMVKYNKSIRPKKIAQITPCGKVVKIHINGGDAAIFSGVCRRNILQVANKTEYKPGRSRSQAGGFIWKFVEDIK